MTFRRLLGALSTVACVLVGLLRLLALVGSTEASTGFLLSGSLTLHYILLAAPLVLALAASFAIPSGSCHTFSGGAGVPAFCGLLFSGVVGICMFALQRAALTELAAAVLMALGCLWFSARILRGSDVSPVCGVLGTLGWLLVCVMLFSGKTASLYHITNVIELLGSAVILLFLCGLLRAAYSEDLPGISRMVFFRGMAAFYTGFCLLMPQELWLWSQGQPAQFLQGKSIAAALLGVCGLISALRCMCTAGTEAVQTDPDADAAFERAGRMLDEDGAVYAMGEDARTAPQPQRWSSAASALYGGTVPTAEKASSQPSPTTINEAVKAPAAEEKKAPAAPKAETSPAVETDSAFTSDEKAPASDEETETAPAEAPAAALNAASAAGAIAPQPAAENTAAGDELFAGLRTAAPVSTMDRLDLLLETISSSPRNDSIDALLKDLDLDPDQLTAAKELQKAAETDGEKWVFRRD